MGSFLANLHVRGADRAAVERALADLATDFRVTDPHRGWVSVYEARASTQDADWIQSLTASLSRAVGAPTVAFMVHDSDLLLAWVAEGGQITGHLDTWPGWPDSEPAPRIDDPEGFLALADGVAEDQLTRLVTADQVFADDTLTALAGLLGLDPDRALTDFRDEDGGGSGGAPGGGLAELLGQLQQALGPDAPASSPGAAALVEAAHAGDVAEVRRLLDAREAPDALGPWRPSRARSGPMAGLFPEIAVTPLYAAASENRADAIRALAAGGAALDRRVPQGDFPLAAAACTGHLEALDALLDVGADPRATRADGLTAAGALAAARPQLAALRDSMAALPMVDLAGHLPSAARLDACAERLAAALGG